MDKKISLLIVDDDDEVRELLEEVVETWAMKNKYNIDIDTAEDGLAGLEKLNSKKTDVTIVDMKMPKLNGHKMIESVRAADGMSKATEIIILSGYPELYMDIIDQENLSVCQILDKPVDLNDLRKALEEVVRPIFEGEKNTEEASEES